MYRTSKDIYQLHNFFILMADVIFVNGIPFFVTFSQNIILITYEYVHTSTWWWLSKYLMNIVKLYSRGGFVTFLVIMDMEFEKVRYKVGLLEFNTTAARDNVA